MEAQQEFKNYEAVQMNLQLATKEDLWRFKTIGFLYFVKDHETKCFLPYPHYTHKGMDIKLFYWQFNLELIYIPINAVEVMYLTANYKKIENEKI